MTFTRAECHASALVHSGVACGSAACILGQPLGLPAATISKPVWFRTPLAWGGKDFAKFSSILMHLGLGAGGPDISRTCVFSAHLPAERPPDSLELLWSARQHQKTALRATRKPRGDERGGQHENFLSRHGNDAWRRVVPAKPHQTVQARLRVRTPAIRFLPPPPGPRQEELAAAVRRLTTASAASIFLPRPHGRPAAKRFGERTASICDQPPGGRVLLAARRHRVSAASQ